MANDMEHSDGETSKAQNNDAAVALAPTPSRSPIVAEFSRVDETGRERKYLRTRNGRELKVLDETDAAWFAKVCPFDPDL